jgi:outer membrane protein assembly factor BamA
MSRRWEIPSLLRGIAGQWRRSFCGPIVVAILSIILIVDTQAFGFTIVDLDPSHHYKLAKLELSGAHAFSRDVVVSVMTTKERSWYQVWKPLPDFDAQKFTDDLTHIERFYEAHGYYNARINYDLTLNKDKVTAHINVSEGQPIRVATIDTKVANRSPPPQELDRSFKLPLKKGDVFDQDAYQAGAQDRSVSTRLIHTPAQRYSATRSST